MKSCMAIGLSSCSAFVDATIAYAAGNTTPFCRAIRLSLVNSQPLLLLFRWDWGYVHSTGISSFIGVWSDMAFSCDNCSATGGFMPVQFTRSDSRSDNFWCQCISSPVALVGLRTLQLIVSSTGGRPTFLEVRPDQDHCLYYCKAIMFRCVICSFEVILEMRTASDWSIFSFHCLL